ncbi:MAG TPA: endonuclease domain-containing protein [Bacteroidota bacterium]
MEKATKENHYLYNKKLRPLGKALRGNMTKAEACLWKYVLRAGLLKGYTFNRQRAIKNYIVDFFCKKLHLVIEVDGITHDSEAVQRKDNDKERELTDAGFTVIRFTDDEVLNNIDG